MSPGDTVGPYRIIEPLGAGGMGVVFRAHDTKLDRDVALKLLPEGLAASTSRIAQLEREARAASSLDHLNIITIPMGSPDGNRRFRH